tara:strand:+ start:5472 stop:6344 length:873 start_codon:yes stop_codon:yes gene_type:complete
MAKRKTINIRSGITIEISRKVRSYLIDFIKSLPTDRILVSTSGGIDSSVLVVAGLEAGVKVDISSFTLDDRRSRDFKSARKLANYFGLEFKPIYLPTNPDVICNQVMSYMRDYKVRRKTDVECVYPISIQMSQLPKGTHYVGGFWADGHFCVSKKGMIHFKHTKELYQQNRYEYFFVTPRHQRVVFKNMADAHGLYYYEPYWGKQIFNMMSDINWDQANKPRQKEILRYAFPELDPLQIKTHTNLQLGDSGIAETVGNAMKNKFTPKAKSAVSAYNFVVKQGLLNDSANK